VKRLEDRRLLTGAGRYVDDIVLPGMLHAAFLRSAHGHAAITSLETAPAEAVPGVVAVLTYDRLAPWMQPLPTRARTTPRLVQAIRFRTQEAAQYPMCRDRARYAGEIIAMVVARDPEAADAGAGAIQVGYEALPAVEDAVRGSAPDAPRLHDHWDSNVALEFSHTVGDPDAAFAEADVVVRERFRIQRYAGVPLEPRGVIAAFDRRDGALTTWNSTQIPHFQQQEYLAAVFGLPAHKVRVIAPDVGGGFGTKANGYAEDVLVPLGAQATGRPVKWVEGRREHFLAAAHARQQVHEIEIAARRDGTILGVRDRIWVDIGAYNLWHTLPYNTAGHLLGPLRVKHLAVSLKAVVTNKMVCAPYRGAGRPEAAFAMDRIVDRLARASTWIRRTCAAATTSAATRCPTPSACRTSTGRPLVYDSGDFRAGLEAALHAAGYREFRAEQARLRGRGIYRGIGISGYVEGTGLGPWESASVRVDQTGKVLVATGAASQGQGYETALAQLAADALDVPLDWVTVVSGDTAAVPYGMGTYASRGAVTAGNSIVAAARDVRQKLAAAAARMLEAAPEDLEFERRRVFVRGVPDSALPLARVVQAALPAFAAGGIGVPEFEASAYVTVPTVTFASGFHVVQVEVDPETGAVTILRYVVAHDCGRVINPFIVEGQIHGGVAQGIGGALLEELVYDQSGQLLTASLADYALPRAAVVPRIATVHLEHPSPRNPLGVKGVGEGGAIAPPAAVANAIEDALARAGGPRALCPRRGRRRPQYGAHPGCLPRSPRRGLAHRRDPCTPPRPPSRERFVTTTRPWGIVATTAGGGCAGSARSASGVTTARTGPRTHACARRARFTKSTGRSM
jgi:carbon-monoxide dehydrogenase large subunit